MFLESLLKRKGILTLMLCLAVLCGISPSNALAMPVDSQLIIHSGSTQSIYLEKVQNFLNKKIVQSKLATLGLTQENAQQYISSLDEVQLQKLANKIDTIEAAGGDAGVVVLLILLLLAICVLYFADYKVKLVPRRKK